MKKKVKLYILSIVSMLLLSSCGIGNETIPASQNESSLKPSLYETNAYENPNRSFHGNTSGINRNWYVVKFSSPSTIHVDELYVKILHKCEESRENFGGFVLTNLTSYPYYSMIGGIDLNKSDLFFHINIGSFNYTYDHLDKRNHSGGSEIWWWNFNLSPDTWYLICLATETVECEIEVWINTTGGVEFLDTSEGTDTFLWSTEEFLGNLNIKLSYYMIVVINGRKEIEINNTFVGFFFSGFGWGVERLQYADPDGNLKKAIIIHEANHEKLMGDFDPRNCIIGKRGVWKFKVDLFLIGNLRFIPWMGMVGADVKLP